ncbi:MAG: gamma carbonic anhydrase family protein [Reyranella sp.]|nr:gamma carbonic anhydrase family protein [Reyranella sp.]
MSGLIVPFGGVVPKVHASAFIAPNATLVGDVEIGADCGIWFGAVLRADGVPIRIGAGSNIQDGSVIHIAARGVGTTVGRNVTVGHMVLLHACEVQDDAFIGMHSTVLDEVVVETGAMVAAGAVVTPRKIVRKGELWAGNPAVKMRDITEKDIQMFKRSAAGYVKLAQAYRGDMPKAAE